MKTGNRDELAFLIVSSLVVLGFVAHIHGPGLVSFQQLAAVVRYESKEDADSAQFTTHPIPVCPFASADSIFVFEFGDTPLVGQTGPLALEHSIAVPPGTYTVRAFSYDQAHDRAQKRGQQYEQWYLDILLLGTPLATLGPTRDLADELPLTRSFDTLAVNLTLPQGASDMVARHARPGLLDNSVVPKCVVFERQ